MECFLEDMKEAKGRFSVFSPIGLSFLMTNFLFQLLGSQKSMKKN